MTRYGSVIEIKSEMIDAYKQLHAAVWPGVLKKVAECNIRNYAIFLRKLDQRQYAFIPVPLPWLEFSQYRQAAGRALA